MHSVLMVFSTKTKSSMDLNGLKIDQTVQNQPRKPSDHGLPKFILVNMLERYHQLANFNNKSWFLRNTFLKAQCQMVFLADSELSDLCNSHKV